MVAIHLLVGQQCCNQHTQDRGGDGDDQAEDEEEEHGGDGQHGRQEGQHMPHMTKGSQETWQNRPGHGRSCEESLHSTTGPRYGPH